MEGEIVVIFGGPASRIFTQIRYYKLLAGILHYILF